MIFFINTMKNGGAEIAIRQLASKIAPIEKNIIYHTFDQNANYSVLLDANYTVKSIYDIETFFIKIPLIRQIEKIFLIRAILKKNSNSCVISFMTNVNILVILANAGLRTRIIVSERSNPNVYPRNFILRLFRDFLYRNVEIVCQTHCALNYFENRNFSNATVINNFIPNRETVELDDFEFTQSKKYILNIAQFRAEKNHFDLIKIFHKVAQVHDDVELILIGDGVMKDSSILLANTLKIGDKIHFLGERIDVIQFYMNSYLFVLTSNYEGYPNVLIESLSHGLPVVSVNCDCGPSEIIAPGVNGILVEKFDLVDSMTKVILDLISSPEKYLSLSNGAKAWTVSDRNDVILDKWKSLLYENSRTIN